MIAKADNRRSIVAVAKIAARTLGFALETRRNNLCRLFLRGARISKTYRRESGWVTLALLTPCRATLMGAGRTPIASWTPLARRARGLGSALDTSRALAARMPLWPRSTFLALLRLVRLDHIRLCGFCISSLAVHGRTAPRTSAPGTARPLAALAGSFGPGTSGFTTAVRPSFLVSG